ncbi:Glucosamine 6-phosphate synthetase, contains amidotransferase and phosphosugar isomerase domain [uncultured spirochete]|jgi:glucosamine--fructose-6-phosphate aminotransferase (isomerizing)|uniref:Glutamine--fructose-6-phosphate aminotransferase [isomerizing] n=1 Tax=uncultured spirochete TaxID=156406 RepID=A0A3P3XRD1_9SPIR|nr:Glucosamine 6-phosphate synthetase, contains amidotransferase and phosphosugar isomerase domain [uncultured spirochete]
MHYEKKVMLEEILLQPSFLKENGKAILENLNSSLKKHDISAITHLYILGCGDSYYSALANRMSLMEMTGLYVESIEALEFSRYVVNYMPTGSAVIGVSNSGTVSRTIEGVKRAREKGALTFAITTSMTSPLAQAVDIPLIVNSPPNIKERPDGPPVVTPGSVSYIASLLGVYCVGIAFGKKLGRLTDENVQSRLAELDGLADNILATIKLLDPIAREYAEKLPVERRLMILGGGPNYATAFFSVAKLFEGLRHPASAVEMEEWAHEEYFISDKDASVFVIVPPGESRSRALEQMRAAHDMGAEVIAICSAADVEIEKYADVLFPISGAIREELTPFIYCVPFELFSCYLSSVRNKFFLGFDDPKRREVNFRQIFNSQIKDLQGKK